MATGVIGRKPTRTQILASVGCLIIFGINVSYQVVMTSFPHILPDMGITKIEASLMPTVVSLGTIVMSLIGTKLIDAITPRWSMLAGSVLVTLFLIGNAFVTSYIPFVALGLVAGFGSALGATGAIAAIMRQYWGMDSASKFSIVCGIQTFVVAGYTALLAWLWTFTDYRGAFLIIAAMTFVLGAGANFICFRKPDAFVTEELAATAQAQKDAEAESAKDEVIGWTFGESFRHSPIYLFTFGFLAAAVINGGITTFLTTLLTESGMAPGTAALFQSYFIVVCGIHILYCGFIQERFGNKGYFIFFYGLAAVGFVLLAVWAGMSQGAMLVFLAIAIFVAGAMKPILSCVAIVATDLFGNKDYTAYNAYGQAVMNTGRLISSASTATIMQLAGSVALCYVYSALSVLAVICFCLADIASPFAKKANALRKEKYPKKE